MAIAAALLNLGERDWRLWSSQLDSSDQSEREFSKALLSQYETESQAYRLQQMAPFIGMAQTDILTPEEFRNKILVDCDGTPTPFGQNLDGWQRQDFEAMDGGWEDLAGIGDGQGCRTAYLERPKGHSKTTDEAVMVLWALYAVPRKITGYGAASDRDQAKLLRDAVDSCIRLNPWVKERIEINKFEIVNKHTGSICNIIASDEAGSHGHLPDFVIADEVTHWKKREFWDALFANTGKRKNCILVVIANAGLGIGISWQWFLRESFREDPDCYFRRLDGPTASWITAEKLAKQQARLPLAVYRRLWLNIWAAGEGDALDPEDIAAAFAGADGPMLDRAYHNRVRDYGLGTWRFVAGLDLGVMHDHSALVVLAVQHGKPRIRLAYCQSWKPKPGEQVQLAEVQEAVEWAHTTFHLDRLVYDRDQAVQMTQALTRQGLYCEQMTFSGKNLNLMATVLLTTFRTRTIDLYPCPDLEKHLRQLTIIEKEWGFKLESARTEDGHADTAIALAIALPEAQLMSHHQAGRQTGIEAKSIVQNSKDAGVNYVRTQKLFGAKRK